PGHTVAIDERIGSGPYAEIASGLPAGPLTLVRQLEGPPRRVYDPSGVPETRRYRVRIVDASGQTIAEAETAVVDTTYVTCPVITAASASRLTDGACDIVKGIRADMANRITWIVDGVMPGDDVRLLRAING